MSRFAAYLGPAVALETFLLTPEHSLVRQSWEREDLDRTPFKPDGFGIGWYDPEDRPATYRNLVPIWSDPNLRPLARTLHQPLWVGSVRSATPDSETGTGDTQPFASEQLLFMHSGFVTDFVMAARPRIRHWLRPEIEAEIHGRTDSEYLFAVLRQTLDGDPDLLPEDGLRQLCELVARWSPEGGSLLNLCVTDGFRIYAVRHALGEQCATLYYTTDDDLFPNGQIVASEPLTDSEFWRPVPAHHLLILDPDDPPALSPL